MKKKLADYLLAIFILLSVIFSIPLANYIVSNPKSFMGKLALGIARFLGQTSEGMTIAASAGAFFILVLISSIIYSLLLKRTYKKTIEPQATEPRISRLRTYIYMAFAFLIMIGGVLAGITTIFKKNDIFAGIMPIIFGIIFLWIIMVQLQK